MAWEKLYDMIAASYYQLSLDSYEASDEDSLSDRSRHFDGHSQSHPAQE